MSEHLVSGSSGRYDVVNSFEEACAAGLVFIVLNSHQDLHVKFRIL